MKLTDIRKLSRHFAYGESAATQEQVQAYLVSLGYDPSGFYQELEMESPLVDTHRDTSYSNARLQLHSHSFYELLYCRGDCGAEYLVGSKRYRLQRGDIIFIPPGVSHRPLLPEIMTEPYRRYVLWLSPEFMERFASLFLPDTPKAVGYSTLLRTAGTKWENLAELFRSGVAEAEKQAPGWEAFVVGNAIVLLTQIGRAIQERSAMLMKAEKPELLDQVLRYIEGHFQERITLAETASCFYVSESTISQTFREKMGVSFYRCVTQRRLIAAKALIQMGETLEKIGQKVGFADYSTFYRAFRKEYGISPRQYRKLQEEANASTLA